MGDERNRILDLLATGKITADEAGRLLDALDESTGNGDNTDAAAAGAAAKTGWTKFFAASGNTRSGDKTATSYEPGKNARGDGGAKFLFVKVLSSAKGDNVNIKIPLGVLRAGLKLTTLIPKPAADQINKTMEEKGISFDLNDLKPEDLQELIDALSEMEIEVDANNGDTIRVYAA